MARLLVWNRGEIAVRIAVAAERLGVTAIAAVVPADGDSRVLEFAHELHWLSGDPASAYRSLEALREAIERTRATHVHPGYGHLADAPELARAVSEAGAVFVGPPESLLTDVRNPEAAAAFAREAGLPTHDALPPKALERVRHVELQIFGVSGRGVRVLDSRDCSVQREGRKLVEEGPAPNRTLAAIGPYRLGLERALSRRGFRSAGTVELLYSEITGQIAFRAINPRIQVEHPVTEMRLGIDLVEWQLREALGIGASELFEELDAPRCHVIELRMRAESPAEGFAPSTGRVHLLEPPVLPWARWDSALREGAAIGPETDSTLAKLLVVGATREEACIHARIALDHLHLHGVATNVELLRAVVSHATFAKDGHDLAWLEAELDALLAGREPSIDLAPIRQRLGASVYGGAGEPEVARPEGFVAVTRMRPNVLVLVHEDGARVIASLDAQGRVHADVLRATAPTERLSEPALVGDEARERAVVQAE